MRQLIRQIRDAKISGESEAFESFQSALVRSRFRVEEKALISKSQDTNLSDEPPLHVRGPAVHGARRRGDRPHR